jgi:general stress protein CsbA
MRSFVHFIPIATSIFSIWFGMLLVRRYRERGGMHHFWWAIGAFAYAAGTITESLTTLIGWHEPIFRAWYISGALFGGFPLAQGTVYLLFSRKTADRLTSIVLSVALVAAACVLLSPINYSLVETHRLSGRVLEWSWVRAFSPFINLYAVIFLVGGAVYSALKYRKMPDMSHRVIGNWLIALGAILPGIGGSFTRFGHVEVLYVTELVGIVLIYFGFRFNVGGRRESPKVALEAAT